jgi:glutamyl-tRNA reductase
MVDHQVEVLRRRLLDRAASSVARSLADRYRDIADELFGKAVQKDLRKLDSFEKEAVEQLIRTVTRRLSQVPIRGLKRAAWDHSISVFASFEASLEEGTRSAQRPVLEDSTEER